METPPGLSSRLPLRMAVKMTFIEADESSGTQIMLKWRNNLGETAFLPPPGGAQAAINLVSLTTLNRSFFVS